MTQHLLLSPAAKTLSLAKVLRMSDKQAEEDFRAIRWTDGDPICPECGATEHYDLKSRPVWKCKACFKQFSLTSGTVFHSRKLKLQDTLGAIAIFTNGAKGYSALQLSRDLSCGYKSAFVLLHKLRESIELARAKGALQGDVELALISAVVSGGANRKEDRIDLRKAKNQSGRRQSVIVARENGRTIAFATKREADGVAFARKAIKAGSTVHADEASHWDVLAANFPIKRVNHQVCYSAPDGACTNQAESFFSRMRRAEIGIHHRIAGIYLQAYATEMAWREDARATIAPKSGQWCGYWQRHSA